ncbi:MAG: type II toxin-antitoxin system RelE/ParE family toxin [Pseudomonadota bacterium]
MNTKKVLIYKDITGKEPFVNWLETQDKISQIRIRKRIARIEIGNLGDYKAIDSGVFELRFFFGSGYRVYFGMLGDTAVILLCGGDKSSQEQDIKKAISYWKEVQNEIIS